MMILCCQQYQYQNKQGHCQYGYQNGKGNQGANNNGRHNNGVQSGNFSAARSGVRIRSGRMMRLEADAAWRADAPFIIMDWEDVV